MVLYTVDMIFILFFCESLLAEGLNAGHKPFGAMLNTIACFRFLKGHNEGPTWGGCMSKVLQVHNTTGNRKAVFRSFP